MKIAKKFKRTIVFLLKMFLFASLFAIFFGIFGIRNPWLFNLSRTTGVTMVTFVVLGVSLLSVYGGYAIGVQKSKPIIYSMTLATIITDLVTHLQLCIMNSSATMYGRFVYETPHYLLLVMILQIIVIIIMTYAGNFIYFSIEPPENCCILAASEQSLSDIIPKVKKFKKQYKINAVLPYDSKAVYDVIDKSDTVFIYDVPADSRSILVDYCYQGNKNIYYNFEIVDVVSMGAKFITIDDKSLVSHTVKEMTLEQRLIKRIMDIFVSLVGFIITSPILLAAAIAIKREDGGKILYHQKRLTKNGQVFQVLKFRTMREENSINKSVTENDDRITKVGAVLRKFRIDELPQLMNILRGDMSLVGPRPEMLENVAKYTDVLPEFSYRLRVKAGLTGLAQISGKYNTTPMDKLILDLMYIERFSIWQDIKIIFQTVTVLFRASDSTEAFRQDKDYKFDKEYINNANSSTPNDNTENNLDDTNMTGSNESIKSVDIKSAIGEE